MQVNFNSYRATSPSFGMAKLTEKGQQVVEDFMKKVPEFKSDEVYLKKDKLAKLISASKKNPATAQDITEFFQAGMTDSAYQNSQFAKKQLTPVGLSSIKNFLKKQSKVSNGEGTTETGKALVESVMDFFDKNIANPLISAKDGKKILSSVKEYADPVKFSDRLGVLSDKMLSK